MTRRIQRRDVLRGAGAASIAAIAGCATEEADDGAGGDDAASDDDASDDGGMNGDDSDVPDAVMVVGFPQSGIQLFRDYYSEFADQSPDLDIIVPDGLIDPDLPGEVDNDMNNVIGTNPSAAGPGAEFYADEYEAAYGESPGVFTAQAYDAMAVNILATVAAGENDGTEVRNRVRTVTNPDGEEFGPETLVDAVRPSPRATGSATSERRPASTSTSTATSSPPPTTSSTSETAS